MNNPEPDALTRLVWTLRNAAWLLVAAPVVAVAGVLVLGPTGPLAPPAQYRTSALVVATKLEVWHEMVPRLTSAVFHSGAVAERVAQQIPGENPIHVAELLSVEPVEETIAVRLVARFGDPAGAARLANLGAQAFAAELNKLGPAVGVFEVVEPARAPADPEGLLSPVALAALALLGGLLFALGLAGMGVLLRRPMIEPDEAALAADAPVVGVVCLGRSVTVERDPPGLAALARRLYATGGERWTLLGCDGPEVRDKLLVSLCGWLLRRGPVVVIPEDRARLRKRAPELERERNVTIAGLAAARRGVPLVADAGSALAGDPLERVPAGSRVLLAVAEGTPQARVEAASAQVPREILAGIVFVQRRGPLRAARLRSWRLFVAASQSAGQPAAEVEGTA